MERKWARFERFFRLEAAALCCVFSLQAGKSYSVFLFWSRVWGFRSETRQREVEKNVSFFVFRFLTKKNEKNKKNQEVTCAASAALSSPICTCGW